MSVCVCNGAHHTFGHGINLDFFACSEAILDDLRQNAAERVHKIFHHFAADAASAEMGNFRRGIYKTGVAVGGVQPHSHVNARAAAAENVGNPSPAISELGHLGEDAGLDGEVRLHEGDGRAGAKLLR